METQPHESVTSADPPAPARFRWASLLVWMPACLVHGGVVAWAAVFVERFRAPVLLFSLLVGVVLGVTLVGLIRLTQVGNRSTILVGAVLAALVSVGGQHYLSYRTACEEAREDAATFQLAKSAFGNEVLGEMPSPPAGFTEFLRWRAARGFDLLGHHARGAVVWLLWAGDALLVLAATLTVVVPALGRPYCDRCRSWFATTRRGPIDDKTARRVAALVETELPDKIASARYRLVTCTRGCALSGFELHWEEPGGSASSRKAWLDHQRRNRIVETLDKG